MKDTKSEAKLKSELEALRANVLERKERIARLREEPIPQDFAEQAVEVENEETKIALEKELSIELNHIEQALGRLAEGNYKFCANCGTDINPDRLRALPYAITCINCAV